MPVLGSYRLPRSPVPTLVPKPRCNLRSATTVSALHDNTLVFSAEGDLWRVGIAGGVAQLTTHPAEESRPTLSPGGRTLAFSASYEAPTEVYTLPLDGGPPTRHTYDGANAAVVGWVHARRRVAAGPGQVPAARSTGVTDRAELNDILSQMVGELSALHIFVRGGDLAADRRTGLARVARFQGVPGSEP